MVSIHNLQSAVVQILLALFGHAQRVEVKRIADPESYVHFGKGHMMGPFLDALAKLPIETAERVVQANPSSQYTFGKDVLEDVLAAFDMAFQLSNGKLRERWLAVVSERSSSKRPAEDDESMLESLPSSHSQKRLRSDSGSSGDADRVVPFTNGVSVSPSPSIAPSLSTEGETPRVSVQMLRSLTRDVLKTYGKNPR
ncbi:uncharacterized protein B0H18DRAFT_1003249 [Fomitopsis serialis]|uniref:uncharacterized protein n=1 Tax=Fomitopsis serialis TaxID=139415 RepID=UPI002007B78B|nr:uncharacterized protein B0H18DRAFT_1003249 [Neoantrodia serialis]KAH9927677.1 hypothetical protein B0H18DRAFT_1003249 [Neoantrodia serialis]